MDNQSYNPFNNPSSNNLESKKEEQNKLFKNDNDNNFLKSGGLFENSNDNIISQNDDKNMDLEQEKEKESEINNNYNSNIIDNDNNIIDIDDNNNINDLDNKKMDIEEKEEEEEINEEKETSSTKSEKINNIWLSDEEEIIDDDTDVNKIIDYKKIEEKAKKKNDNKINDLNLLIIPELSEYYFIKSNPENYDFNSSLNIKNKSSVDISSEIIKILNEKIESMNENEEKRNELINIATVYTYFDAFILHSNDITYLMKLRDELFYKYYMQGETMINFEKIIKEKLHSFDSNNNNIESTIKKFESTIFLFNYARFLQS